MNRTVFAAISLFSIVAFVPVAALAQTEATVPPVAASPKPVPVIEPAAMAVLKKSADKMLALKTLRITSIGTRKQSGGKVMRTITTVVAAKPNRVHYEMRRGSGSATETVVTVVSNGATLWRQSGNTYTKSNGVTTKSMDQINDPIWTGFFDRSMSLYSMVEQQQRGGYVRELRLAPSQTVDGVLCDAVRVGVTMEMGKDVYRGDLVLYIGQKDGIVRRQKDQSTMNGKFFGDGETVIRNIVLNAPIKAAKTTFAYTPPKGVTLEKPAPPAPERKEEPLLANETPAPDFSATDIDGKPAKLSDFAGKVVVVDFWASWCPPCVASMPHNQKVIAKLQAEGLPVVLLAVDNGEGREPFEKWVKAHPEYAALKFVHADRETNDISNKLYKVSGIPTQYVVGADGTIRWSTVGFGGETDDLEKAIRAALPPK